MAHLPAKQVRLFWYYYKECSAKAKELTEIYVKYNIQNGFKLYEFMFLLKNVIVDKVRKK